MPNNRVSGSYTDANGNQGGGFAGIGPIYDAANRVSEVYASPNDVFYAYDSDNRRIAYQDPNRNTIVYLYGVDGKKLGAFAVGFTGTGESQTMTLTQQSYNAYFAGMLVVAESNSVATDRLGSVRWGGPNGLGYQAQFPYGQEYTTTANDREKYATYTRDSISGLDYAVNRYYWSQWGRFLSPDPYMANSSRPHNPKDPGSWNLYAYTRDDPVNRVDISERDDCDPEDPDCCDPGDPDCPDPCGPVSEATGAKPYRLPNPFDYCDDPGDGGGAPSNDRCTLSVASSGAPRDGQDVVGLSIYSPPTNQLGAYKTAIGWFEAVQIQANLSGDTNGYDWTATQSVSDYGWVRLSRGQRAVKVNNYDPNDGPAAFVTYAGTGTYDWLDTPGLPVSQSSNGQVYQVYSAFLTFSFASTLTNKISDQSCSVDWGFKLSVVGKNWKITFF